jgi:hypothetical protein
MATWTEIAIDMARVIAAQNGCELESFSLDGVDTYEEDGVEMVMVKASCRIAPSDDLDDDIPFELEDDNVPIVS